MASVLALVAAFVFAVAGTAQHEGTVGEGEVWLRRWRARESVKGTTREPALSTS
jgi:hypothetical protein